MKLAWTKTSPRYLTAVLPSGDVYNLVRDRHDTRYWHASWTPAEEQAAGTLFNFTVTDSEGTPAWAKQKAAAHAEKVQENRTAGATWTGEAWRYAAKKNPGAPLRGSARAAWKRNPTTRAPTYRQPFHAATWFITSRAGIKMAAEDVEWCRLSGYPTQSAEKSLRAYIMDARQAGASPSDIEAWKLAGEQEARKKFKVQSRTANPAKGRRKNKTQRRALGRQK